MPPLLGFLAGSACTDRGSEKPTTPSTPQPSVLTPRPGREPGDPARASSKVIPRRIIALAPSTAEIVCDLGAADRLVAVGRYCVYPPAIANLPKIGGLRDPELETILILRPDLVMVRGRSDLLDKLCRDNGISIYDDPTETLADIERAVFEIGSLLGLPDRATEIVADMRAELATIRHAVAGSPKPRVLFTSRNPDQLANIYTVARGSYLDELIALAGGENIFGDQDVAYPMVSLEEVVARQPEVILESLFGETDAPGLRDSVVGQWRAVGPIPAVLSGRIHIMTADYATVPSPRVVHMAADLVKLIHPEVSVGSQ
ncbi:MAG: helical backbone metal receptor [Planctomycetota bacterium]